MDNNKSERDVGRDKIPLAAFIMLSIAALSGVILAVSVFNPQFADFINKYICGTFRFILAKITDIFPFSLAEFLIILLPVTITLLILYAIRKKSHSLKAMLSYFVTLIASSSVVFSLFVFTFAPGYHTPSLYQRFDIQNDGVSPEELKATAIGLAKEVNARIGKVNFSSDGSSVMPYSLSEMNSKLIKAFKITGEKYGFVQSFSSKVKPVMLSVPMSYTHTTGVYTFFTGEANLNIDFPDYTLTFTAAHELAHQRGIAREDEANFMAFLVGTNSLDSYIEYCAYLNMFEYISAALYNASPQMYSEVMAQLSEPAKGEMRAYSAFFEKYRDSKAGEVSSAINNAYLVANGTAEGTKSYGLAVDLAVAWFGGDFDLN